MYLITVESDFDAAHCLRNYGGKCEALHGHRFVIRVTVGATVLNEIGLAYDFTVLKRHLNDILARFDHAHLNDTPPFTEINPSSENIATLIYDEMRSKIAQDTVSLESIEVWESPTSHVTYRP